MRIACGKYVSVRGSSRNPRPSPASRSRQASATCAVSSYASSSNVFSTARSADSSRHDSARYVAASASSDRSRPVAGSKTETPLPTRPSASIVRASSVPSSCQATDETLPKLMSAPVAIVRTMTSTPSLSLSSGL